MVLGTRRLVFACEVLKYMLLFLSSYRLLINVWLSKSVVAQRICHHMQHYNGKVDRFSSELVLGQANPV